MLKQGDHEGKKLDPITFKSMDFKGLFEQGIDIDGMIKKLRLSDIRTLHSFLKSPNGKNETTYDFFSVFLGFSGWIDFRSRYVDQKAIISQKDQSLIDSTESISDETEISIPGTITINEAFLNKIQNGPKISRTDYYISSYDNDGQWYGIIQNYDVLRKIYSEDIMLPNGVIQRSVKNQLSNLFVEEYYVELKVSGIFHGDGGAGKSTLLKRLAIDLCSEQKFQILWVTDLDRFIADEFEMIKNSQINFLVFIEDWYRMVRGIPNATKFLKDSREINNVRFIIGDRTIGDEYKQFLNNDLNIQLTTEENPQILAEILNECPEWKPVAKQLFENKTAYNSTLFLLLFIIARVSANKVEIANRQPERIFEDIIASDFKDIECENSGLAKILQQWACIYTKNKIFISTDTFLEIANRFNGNNELSSSFSWNSDDPLQRKLKIYINNSHNVGKHSDKDFIRFNHDILAELGLSKLKLLLDKEKRKLLEIITEIGDDHSASLFLSTMLRHDQQIFINREDKFGFINQLIDKKNNHYSYTVDIVLLKPTNAEWELFAKKNLDAGIYSPVFWKGYFKSNSDKSDIQNNIEHLLNLPDINKINKLINICLSYATNQVAQSYSNKILNDPDWKKTHHQIICNTMRFADDETILEFSDYVLNDLDWREIHYQIICDALRLADDEYTMEFSNTILSDLDWKKTHHQIICNALRYADDEIILEFSNNTLKDLDWKKTSHDIICNTIRLAEDEITTEFSNNVLKDLDWKKIPKEIICNAMRFAEDGITMQFSNNTLKDLDWKKKPHDIICNAIRYAEDEIKTEFSNNVLKDLDWKNIPQHIICNAIRYAEDEITMQFSNNVLSDPDWGKSPYQIICLCLGLAKNKEVATSVLNEWKSKHWNLVYNSLKAFENEKTLPSYVKEVIEEIILNYHIKDYSNKQYIVSYSNLFRINFHFNCQWVEESGLIIKNWYRLPRDLITNVIWGYRMLPNKTTGVCRTILHNWQKEVNQNIPTVDQDLHKGDHVKLALGHPHLRLEAKQAAIEMDTMLQTNYSLIPESFDPIIMQIVEEDIYPDWVIS